MGLSLKYFFVSIVLIGIFALIYYAVNFGNVDSGFSPPEERELCWDNTDCLGDAVCNLDSDGRRGVCTCQGAGENLIYCKPEGCVDYNNDKQNCGSCNHECRGEDSLCSDGACACTGDLTYCDGLPEGCFSLQENPHCGACGSVCGGDGLCTDGECVCDPGTTLCNHGDNDFWCADLDDDNRHCGVCGNSCDITTHRCMEGQCVETGDDNKCSIKQPSDLIDCLISNKFFVERNDGI